MNFTAILETTKLVFSMMPIILDAMKAVEGVMGDCPGTQKLEIVRLGIQAAYDKVEGMSTSFDDMWPTFESLISKLKASKLFKATPAEK